MTVIDDFAHHPTSVRESVAAARQRFADSRIVAVFEPRSYTAQRKEFEDAFRGALGTADRVVLAGLYHPERYDARTGMDPRALVEGLRSDGVEAAYIPEVGDIVRAVASEASAGDVLLVMSNGAFGGIHEKLLERLASAEQR
ncbi:MAG: cyanophycin synthetase [Gemmatimonadota bacterium]|nr:cyanophycin synthetase [Gemmatimonadota bacterium]